jgi:predicted dehydrogenase
MPDTLDVGLIGAGGMAGVYADRLAAMDGARVAAVASPNTADEFATERGLDVPTFADAAALCEADDLDAVAVCSPTHRHREHVEAAAASGLEVICEKPLARTLAGAEAAVEACEDAGVTLFPAHAVRFFPAYATARNRVEAENLGDVGVARARRAVGFAGDPGWFGDEEKSGGPLLDFAVHDFDYLRWVLGPVERVFARRSTWADASTAATTLLRFESGAVGHVETVWGHVDSQPFTTALELAGDRGCLEFDREEVRPVAVFDADGRRVPRDPVTDEFPLERDGYRRQLEHFRDCVREGRAPDVTPADGVRAVRLSLAAIESAERGHPVAPAEVGR